MRRFSHPRARGLSSGTHLGFVVRFVLPLLLCLPGLLLGLPLQVQEEAAAVPDQAELERQFEETMSGSRLVGQFSVVGPDGGALPRDDLYMVSGLSRGEGDRWVFTSKMKYGETEVSLPVPTEVKWAGDTPVIVLTDQEIPGLGTFTARVMIYKDRYAGTWQHGPVGGHMWGTIEKVEEEGAAEE